MSASRVTGRRADGDPAALGRVRRAVARRGWTTSTVTSDVPWTVTIGLAEKAGVELAVRGLKEDVARSVLEDAARQLWEGRATAAAGTRLVHRDGHTWSILGAVVDDPLVTAASAELLDRDVQAVELEVHRRP